MNPTLGATRNVVLRLALSANLGGKGYILVMDRYYNSVVLCVELFKLNIGAVGTIRPNGKHVPKKSIKKKS